MKYKTTDTNVTSYFFVDICKIYVVLIFLPRSIPQQHLLQPLQKAVEGRVVAAVMHAHEQHAHVVEDVHYTA